MAEYVEYGNAMLTTAVFAIVITAPLGAIMINTLGTKWLEYDGDDPEILAKHGLPPREVEITDNIPLGQNQSNRAGQAEEVTVQPLPEKSGPE